MTIPAIIGGTGLTSMEGMEVAREELVDTPYGGPSSKLVFGHLAGREILFLARHGNPHRLPPHKVNYRANLWALKDNGAGPIIAVNAVGGITGEMRPARLIVPDQIIDYTWGRQHSFCDGEANELMHVDFTRPYSGTLRQSILAAARDEDIDCFDGGTYGATQGPRLESAAEIQRMENDGCDIVGMTGMPEAGLARELALDYASIALVVNRAAGKSDEDITMELIEKNMEAALSRLQRLLMSLIPKI